MVILDFRRHCVLQDNHIIFKKKIVFLILRLVGGFSIMEISNLQTLHDSFTC